MAVIIPILVASGQLIVSDNFLWFVDGTIGYQVDDNSTVITPLSIKDIESKETHHVWHTRQLASSSFSLSAHLIWLNNQTWAKIGKNEIFEL